MAKKKGFFSAVGRFLGSIPAVGKAKKAAKSVKKKAKAAKKEDQKSGQKGEEETQEKDWQSLHQSKETEKYPLQK